MTDAVRVVQVDGLDCRLVKHAWDFEREYERGIASHWRERTKSNPALFDGPVLLAKRAETRIDAQGQAILELDFFEVRFSRFLAWRDFGFPDRGVYNCFAMPALRSREGAFLLGEMGPRHSCSGQLYFPAGTPDRDDIVGERVDLDASIIRELAEETGICVTAQMFSRGWRVVFDSQRIACMKIIDWPAPGSDLLAQVERHITSEAEPELARGYLLGARAQLSDARLPAFMTAFLEPLLPR